MNPSSMNNYINIKTFTFVQTSMKLLMYDHISSYFHKNREDPDQAALKELLDLDILCLQKC